MPLVKNHTDVIQQSTWLVLREETNSSRRTETRLFSSWLLWHSAPCCLQQESVTRWTSHHRVLHKLFSMPLVKNHTDVIQQSTWLVLREETNSSWRTETRLFSSWLLWHSAPCCLQQESVTRWTSHHRVLHKLVSMPPVKNHTGVIQQSAWLVLREENEIFLKLLLI